MLYIYRRYADRDWLQRHRREVLAQRANQITTEYLTEFFGHYLRGRDLELLWPDSVAQSEAFATSNYPEVELRVYGR